ncbi:peptidylprolyl isomerase [Angelakisella massiliensis]|uniref:peptidylprolyl isomerase n=1 Tax=Angelakisella massiliensis TaxID=1871018 RepID=UPI0009F6D5C7|nr:peptidylprolyl isomerase [Angelakisella massiliensis]
MENQKDPIITVHMASGGSFAFQLHPQWAPNACNSVISLAAAGAYDGMTIDRIVPGFVIQPRYLDEGRPDLDYFIDGEFEANGFKGNPPVVTGVVAMAGDGATFSSGSCFFITLGDHPRLTGHFTAIGEVVSGWDEIKRLESVPIEPVDTDLGAVINRPITPEIMETVTVETFGVEYPQPVILRRAY